MGVLAAGTSAPTFKLARADGDEFTQEDLLGTTTVLVFYPFAFSAVCTDQLHRYEPLAAELAAGGGVI
jgi:peroxiredoxin